MTEDNRFFDHEMTLFPVKDQVRVLTSLENFIQILKAFVKTLSIDREIFHEDFHDVLDQVREDRHHTLLKRSGCVVETKGHPPVGERAVRTGEGSLILIIRMDRDLMITRIANEVTEIRILGQPFKHFINEGQWEVIFLGDFVKHPVVDTHSPTSNGPMRYELISLVLDHFHASFLWDYLNWAN